VLFDIIASICTPQARQLLQRLQQIEADSLQKPVQLKELVKPVRTRWNSYYAAFARAVELQGPIDNYVEHKIERIALQRQVLDARGVHTLVIQQLVSHLFGSSNC
jgi:hypothetical protein